MSFRIQPRDVRIVDEISEFGGMLSRRHIWSSHWPHSKSPRAMQKRLSKLKEAGYIGFPTKIQYRIYPIPEPIVWLGPRGALLAAELSNIRVEEPSKYSEEQQRRLQRRLRAEGFRWLREPRWMSIRHELVCSDIRRLFEHAISKKSHLKLAEWLHEGNFLTDMDIVEYRLKGRDGRTSTRRKGIRPDGYFMIVNEDRHSRGLPFKAQYLLEIDLANHPNPRFVADKAVPGAAYIKSKAYRERFGNNVGTWLVVTTGQRRLKNLMNKVGNALNDDARVFLFTTLNELEANDVLSSRIWRMPGWEGVHALFGEEQRSE